VPLHFSAFHPDWKDARHAGHATGHAGARPRIAMEAGLRYVYTGNVRHEAGDTTSR
jgi:pyruvate formate lyase activating enzyme